MNSASRRDSEANRTSMGIGLFAALSLSGLSVLWFSRSYYLNSGHVGWGDASADREQIFFRWATAISIATLFVLINLAATRSGRFRLAITLAGMLSGAAMLVGELHALRTVKFVVIPGMFASMIAFGVHSDPGWWLRLLWVFGISTAFYATIIGASLALVDRRKRRKEGANS